VTQRCTCCSSPNRRAIDAAILAASAERSIAKQYGVSPVAVHRHKAHIAAKVQQAAKAEGRTLVGILDKAHQDLDAAARWASEGEDGQTLIKAVQARAKLAEVEFGTKQKVEISGDVAALTDEQVEERLAAALAELRAKRKGGT